MKRFISALAITLCMAVGCTKESLDTSTLTGKWDLEYQDTRISVDGATSFTFGSNGEFTQNCYNALADSGMQDTRFCGTWRLSVDGRLLTLFYDGKEVTPDFRQFHITDSSKNKIGMYEGDCDKCGTKYWLVRL